MQFNNLIPNSDSTIQYSFVVISSVSSILSNYIRKYRKKFNAKNFGLNCNLCLFEVYQICPKLLVARGPHESVKLVSKVLQKKLIFWLKNGPRKCTINLFTHVIYELLCFTVSVPSTLV